MGGVTMQAAVLHAAGDLRVEEVPQPEPREGEALVRIRANGLCGSDIHFYEAGRLGPFVVDRPYIPGHEAVGVVEAIGRDAGAGSAAHGAPASRPAPGTRVAIEPGIPCRRCSHCKHGRYNLCTSVRFLSAPPENGTFAEYATLAADFCHVVPDALSDEEAALVEPVSVGVHACNRAAVRPGEPFAVVGAGPIGLITMLVGYAYGAGPATVVDIAANRRAKAIELGAAHAVDGSKGDEAVAEVMELTQGEGVPYVFDTSGASAGCAFAPRITRRGGVVTLVGWPELSAFPFPIEEVIEKELDIRGINRYCNTYPTALRLMESRKLDVRPLISHRFGFNEVVHAFEFASAHRDQTIKVLVGQAGRS